MMRDFPCYELSVLTGRALDSTPAKLRYGGLPQQHTFLVGDFGLFMEHAVRLAQDGHRVLYFTPFFDKFPSFRDYAVGLGMPGVEKPMYFFRELRKFAPADVTVVFPDVGFGDLTVMLRELGYFVFGAGRGDMLENERQTLKHACEQAGIPVAPWRVVTGLKALRQYIADHAEQTPLYIKLDIFRGSMESFPAKSLKSVELLLDRLESEWGPFADNYQFIVEDQVGVEEVGHDGIFAGSDWLRPYMFGTEITKGAYAGIVSARVPEVISTVVDKFGGVLGKLDYRGWCSTEIRVEGEKRWLLDITARSPSPLGIGYTELFDNFSALLYSVARNRPITPIYRGRYLVILPLVSSEAEKHWVYLDFPESLRSRVKLRLGTRCAGSYYVVPGLPTVYVLVSVGDDLEQLRKETLALVDQVHAWDLVTGATAGVTEAVEQLRRLEQEMPGGGG